MMTAALAVAMLVVAAAPAFAQEIEYEFGPLNIEALVNNVEREHGVFVDKWAFTVQAVNPGHKTVFVDVVGINTDFDYYENECPAELWVRMVPGQTVTLRGCFTIPENEFPVEMAILGDMPEDPRNLVRGAVLPFVPGGCVYAIDAETCLPTQNIDHLIEDIEVAPVQCAAPPTVPTQTGVPRLSSTAYHKYSDYIILTFDTQVTLADGWHENIRISAETKSGPVELDGLDEGARNLMPDGSTLVWLTLDFEDARQLNDVTSMTLRISPGTVTYGDGDVLRTMLLPQVEVVP